MIPASTISTPKISWFEALGWTLATGDHAAVYLALVSCVLLALVAGLLVLVSLRLQNLRAQLQAAPLLAETFARQLMESRTAMQELLKTSREAGPALEQALEKSGMTRQELIFLIDRADSAATRLETQVSAAQSWAVPPQTPDEAAGKVSRVAKAPGKDVGRSSGKVAPVTQAYAPPGNDQAKALPPGRALAGRELGAAAQAEVIQQASAKMIAQSSRANVQARLSPRPAEPKPDLLDDLLTSIGAAPAAPIGRVTEPVGLPESVSLETVLAQRSKSEGRDGSEGISRRPRATSQAEKDLKAKLGQRS